jgi:hypothetical protein
MCAAAGYRRLFNSTASSEQAQDEQEDDRADGRGNDLAEQMAPQVETQPRQKPVANKRADDADAEIGDEAETGAAQNLTCQPARDDTDDKDDQETISGQSKTPSVGDRDSSCSHVVVLRGGQRCVTPHRIHDLAQSADLNTLYPSIGRNPRAERRRVSRVSIPHLVRFDKLRGMTHVYVM